MGGSAAARRETENRTSKYKTIKVCILCTVVLSSVNVCYCFLQPGKLAAQELTLQTVEAYSLSSKTQ